eukprot:UN01892
MCGSCYHLKRKGVIYPQVRKRALVKNEKMLSNFLHYKLGVDMQDSEGYISPKQFISYDSPIARKSDIEHISNSRIVRRTGRRNLLEP